ncbi:MAG TPA: extracellular solute-binding protein [Chromatiales bacterium]|nr:extracellular solute-binding protein [Chromatiales bacterium]
MIAKVASLVLVLLLAGCGGEPENRAGELRVYNWTDYIAPSTIPRFEAETGIRVIYDVFDSNEILEAKLLTGAVGHDLVVPTSDFMARQIVAGVFQPLDKARLPNLANLDPDLMAQVRQFDPDNRYGVPYLWGTTGLGYDEERIVQLLGPDVPLDSLDLLFRPGYMRRLAKCGVAVLDAPQEVFAAALNYLGFDPNSTDPSLYQNEAYELLSRVRPYIAYFHSSQYINDLANGDICMVFGWSGDILQAASRAAEAGNGIGIRYVIPREGAMLWFDMLAIPATAENVDEAHAFIDYLLHPDVIAEITATVKYANPNIAATGLVPAAIRNNPGIYPPESVRRRLFTSKLTAPKLDRVMNRVWTSVKTGI